MSSVLQKDPRIHPIYLGTIHTTARELSIRREKGVPGQELPSSGGMYGHKTSPLSGTRPSSSRT